MCVLFSLLLARSRKPAAEGGVALTPRGEFTFRHTPRWPLTIISTFYGLFYRKR